MLLRGGWSVGEDWLGEACRSVMCRKGLSGRYCAVECAVRSRSVGACSLEECRRVAFCRFVERRRVAFCRYV